MYRKVLKTDSLMKKASLALFISLFPTLLFAQECPELTGDYSIQCRITKDEHTEFARVLDSMGVVKVEQDGCSQYRFQNTSTGEIKELSIKSLDTEVISSNAENLSLKRREDWADALPDAVFSSWTIKLQIQKTSQGFELKGKEWSTTVRLFRQRHSKFSCEFIRQNVEK